MNIWPRRLELKKETKADSNQPPALDPVQFKLELTTNYLIFYLENTGSRCTRYVSMPLPNESSILPKFLEKSDPEVARPAFSTWPVQKSQPKAFEVCASIQIHQSAIRVLKFTENLIEGELVEPETRDYSTSLLHRRMAPPDSIRRNLIREEIVTSLVTGRGLQIRKMRAKLSNKMIGKGKSQPRSSPKYPVLGPSNY